MRPCPKCGEARDSHLVDLAPFLGCCTCGLIFDRATEVTVRRGARVVVRGTSGGRSVKPGNCP